MISVCDFILSLICPFVMLGTKYIILFSVNDTFVRGNTSILALTPITECHRLGGLKADIYFSHFWRLEVEEQSLGRSVVR